MQTSMTIYLRLETVVSVLFTNTRTSRMYNERKILYTARRRRGRVQYTKF